MTGFCGFGAEPDTADPLGVALVGDGKLAVAESVPELDGAVAGAGDNLAVVGRERDGEDVVGVPDEATGGLARAQLPEAESLVPGGGQSVGAVGGDDAVADDVGVAVEAALRVPVGSVVTGQVPDDEALVTGTREKHVGAGEFISRVVGIEWVFRIAHFSSEVAKLVTQPEWPSRVPRRTSCSDMTVVVV